MRKYSQNTLDILSILDQRPKPLKLIREALPHIKHPTISSSLQTLVDKGVVSRSNLGYSIPTISTIPADPCTAQTHICKQTDLQKLCSQLKRALDLANREIKTDANKIELQQLLEDFDHRFWS
jgi:Fe2+ or Zn2+ uptake regulation protein